MEEKKNIKMYFKGGKGITDPKDKDGEPIKEGDILTHSWWDREDGSLNVKFWRDIWPNISDEEIDKRANKPDYIVRWDSKGNFFWGEGLKAIGCTKDRSYLHDFCFHSTKKVGNINDNPKLFIEKFKSRESFLDYMKANQGVILKCTRGIMDEKTIEWKYVDGKFYTKGEDDTDFSEGMKYQWLYEYVNIP